MGFFNKKELAEIERLKQQIERKDVINKELREELGEIGLGVDLLTDTIKNLEKTAGSLEKQRDDNYTIYLETREKLISKEDKVKDLEKDIVKTINICNDLEEELNKTSYKYVIYKEALTEIAEYDFDRHKKAYLLNDFFQERAKKALSEG